MKLKFLPDALNGLTQYLSKTYKCLKGEFMQKGRCKFDMLKQRGRGKVTVDKVHNHCCKDTSSIKDILCLTLGYRPCQNLQSLTQHM